MTFSNCTLTGTEYWDWLIRHAFIVNTDDIHLNHYFVDDLIDPDMYLHLNQQG